MNKTSDNSTSLELLGLPDDSETSEQEVIVPINEALLRINELKEADEQAFKEKFRLPSRISKYDLLLFEFGFHSCVFEQKYFSTKTF